MLWTEGRGLGPSESPSGGSGTEFAQVTGGFGDRGKGQSQGGAKAAGTASGRRRLGSRLSHKNNYS